MPLTRVTFSSEQRRIQDNLFRVQREYQKASGPATSGKVVNDLADNPAVTSRIMSFRSKVQSSEQYQRNITLSRLRLNFTDSQLANGHEALAKIREIVLRANEPTNSSSLLSQMASQVADLKSELLTYANAKLDGQYIFSGTATSTVPFSGTPTAFAANSNSLLIQVSTTTTIQINVDGNTIFSGSGGGEDVFDVIDDLQTNIGAADSASIATNLARLDTAMAQVRKARGDLGIRNQQIDSYETLLGEGRILDTESLSAIEEASIDEAFSTLVAKETALRLVFASSSRVLSAITGIQLQV